MGKESLSEYTRVKEIENSVRDVHKIWVSPFNLIDITRLMCQVNENVDFIVMTRAYRA